MLLMLLLLWLISSLLLALGYGWVTLQPWNEFPRSMHFMYCHFIVTVLYKNYLSLRIVILYMWNRLLFAIIKAVYLYCVWRPVTCSFVICLLLLHACLHSRCVILELRNVMQECMIKWPRTATFWHWRNLISCAKVLAMWYLRKIPQIIVKYSLNTIFNVLVNVCSKMQLYFPKSIIRNLFIKNICSRAGIELAKQSSESIFQILLLKSKIYVGIEWKSERTTAHIDHIDFLV